MTQERQQQELSLKSEDSSDSQIEATTITRLNAPFIVGTHEKCNLVLDNSEAVSGEHLSFTVDGDQFFLESIGKSGITLLNGIQLERKNKHKLLTGDRIYLRKLDSEPEVLVVNLPYDQTGSLGGLLIQSPFPEIHIAQSTGQILLRGVSPDLWNILNPEAENLALNEYKLVRALYEQQGRSFSKQEVGELLGMNNRPPRADNIVRADGKKIKTERQQWDHNLNNRISLIRRKIEREGSNPLIIQRNSSLGMPDSFAMPKNQIFHGRNSYDPFG